MKRKNFIKLGLLSFAFLLILTLTLAPGIIKKVAINKSKELVGRQLTLKKLKINYFSSTLRIIDFELFELDEQEAFVSFDTLLINLAPLRLIRKEKVIERLYVKGLEVQVIQEDSLFNFTDLVEFHQSEPDSSQSEPFRYAFYSLEMKDAQISYTDASINKTLSMHDVNFYIPYIAWNQGEKSEAGLKFNFMREGFLESSLKFHPAEKEFDINLQIYRLYFDPFLDYIKKYAPIDSVGGLMNSSIRIEGDLDEIEKSLVSGNMEILDLEIDDHTQHKLVGFDRFFLSLNEVSVYDQHYHFDSLSLEQPYVHFELFDSTNNLFEFLGIHPTPESDSLEEIVPLSSPSFTLNSFILEEGIIDYTDKRTGEPFDYHLSELTLSVDSISNQEEWVDLYSEMRLNNRGQLKANLGLNPQNPLDMNLEVVITDFLLSDLNIYSRHYVGSPILQGDMYYKTTTQILNGELSSENKLIMDNVEIGEKQGGLHDLPLKFALFILKDRKGVVDLDIPVRGDLKNPEISLGKIVWNTLKNLIVKTAAAPYDLLAGLINVEPADIEFIEYAYSDTLLSDPRKKQLDLLLKLEQQKEGLGIELVYFNDLEKEKSQIMASWENLEPSDSLVIDSLLISFQEKRISQVNDYLKMRHDSTTIQTSISNPESPENLGSHPKFVVNYSLKNE